MLMFIYNVKDHPLAINNHILDPDYTYDSSMEKNFLQSYFKNLIKPSKINQVIGIYIKFEISHMSIHQNSHIYEISSNHIQKLLEKHLNYGYANLYNANSNLFFITMFDVDENILLSSLICFFNEIKKKRFESKHHTHQYMIQCGVCISNPFVQAIDFFNYSKTQYLNTLHHNTLLSYQFID